LNYGSLTAKRVDVQAVMDSILRLTDGLKSKTCTKKIFHVPDLDSAAIKIPASVVLSCTLIFIQISAMIDLI